MTCSLSFCCGIYARKRNETRAAGLVVLRASTCIPLSSSLFQSTTEVYVAGRLTRTSTLGPRAREKNVDSTASQVTCAHSVHGRSSNVRLYIAHDGLDLDLSQDGVAVRLSGYSSSFWSHSRSCGDTPARIRCLNEPGVVSRKYAAYAGMATMEERAMNQPNISAHQGYVYVLAYTSGWYLITQNRNIATHMAGANTVQPSRSSRLGRRPIISLMLSEMFLVPYTQQRAVA